MGRVMSDDQLPSPIPESLTLDSIYLEVLHPKHVELDYRAVMKSKNFLRRWSNSSWPTDDFSVDENLSDLVWHNYEFEEKIAFTYTILDTDKQNCLGCIYLRPISTLDALSSEEKEKIVSYALFCTYWVVPEIRSSPKEDQFIKSLLLWFRNDWKPSNIFFASNFQVPEQNKALENNQLEVLLELPNNPRYQLLWKSIEG